MFSASQSKAIPAASAAHPSASDKRLSYAPHSTPYSHFQSQQLHHHLPHVQPSQWPTTPYQPIAQSQNSSLSRHPSSAKTPIHQPHLQQLDTPTHPPPPHHYHPAINLVNSRPHPHPYMYLHHPVMAPVAHVPIGAAHYAHLPQSIWGPTHAQYHQLPPSQHHQRPVHAVAQSPLPMHVHPSGQHPPTHLQHLQQHHAPQHLYTHAPTQPHLPHHEIHPHPLYQPHHVGYRYPPIQQPPMHSLKPPGELPQSSLGPMSCSNHAPHMSSLQAPKSALQLEHEAQDKHPSDSQTLPKLDTKADGTQPRQSTEKHVSQVAANRTLAQDGVGTTLSHKKPHSGRSEPKKEDKGKRISTLEQRQLGSPRQRSQQNKGQPVRKPRKPYTITKSREVWTQEEHARFVHALQLYDRDWKKIEAHIGSKTVLQIRSHAQKHFGKVTKYRTGEYIPPPRPKKRAVLPYPRSRSSTVSKTNSGSAGTASDSGGGSENGNGSGCGNENESVMNGNSSATVSGLQTSPKLVDPVANGRISNSPRTGNRPHIHQQRPRPAAATSLEKAGGMEGSNHPYYDSAGHSYQERGLPRIQTLPPPKVLEVPREPALPLWNGLKPESGDCDTNHNQRLFHSNAPDDIQDGAPPEFSGVGSRDTPAALNSSTDDIGHTPDANENDDKTLPTDNGGASHVVAEQRGESLRHAEGGSHSVVRAEDGGRVPGPNNSLLVLSNCVDMMSRENATAPRSPALGWASAAAARRAHRAKVIRGRETPLPSLERYADEEGEYEAREEGNNGISGNEFQKRSGVTEEPLGVANAGLKTNGHNDGSVSPVETTSLPSGRGESPPVVGQDETDQPNAHDPQRSSAGSGSNSDDAIAGFSCSDRPSGLSSGGSGSGGSLEGSDTGEEDPKSSNDGSGDDVIRQQSPSSRNSSPADPNSSGSGSREDTPNEIATENESGTLINDQAPREDKGERQTVEGPRPSAGSALSKARGREGGHCGKRTERTGLNSIANLCSDILPENKMRIDNLDNNSSKKRPWRSLDGVEGIPSVGQEHANGSEDGVGERAKRKCHSIDGILHSVSVDPRRHGHIGDNYEVGQKGMKD